ncbi:MAG TPA: hypothetical protein VM032_12315 [Vicinamibacterales bacterium]|nr:hypothetical protein [Vicinamibacterales bacterium]
MRRLLLPAIARCLCAVAIAALAAPGCRQAPPRPEPSALDRAAATYLELVAALANRDPDSASGDTAVPVARMTARAQPLTLDEIAAEARAAADSLRTASLATAAAPRRDWLLDQLVAVSARAALQGGAHLTIARELEQLFGIDHPAIDAAGLSRARARIGALLPGRGSAAQRLDAFEAAAIVPRDRVPAVFERALAECRRNTATHVSLPAADGIELRFVTAVPWSGFSTYLGEGRSRIDVNVGYPLTVDRVLDLACHEGYPGHHLLNLRRDLRARDGRPELRALPLFSPESFATESIAASAASLVFTDAQRLHVERDVLYPLAGLGADDAVRHVEVSRLRRQLAPAISDALSRYLAGERDFIETGWALEEEALMAHPRATLLFANQFRGFALAYAWAPAGQTDHDDDGQAPQVELWRRYDAVLNGDYRRQLR